MRRRCYRCKAMASISNMVTGDRQQVSTSALTAVYVYILMFDELVIGMQSKNSTDNSDQVI